MGSLGPKSSGGAAGSPSLEKKETHGQSPLGITPSSISPPGQEEPPHQLRLGTPDAVGAGLCRVSWPSDEEANDCAAPRRSPTPAHPPLLGHPFPRATLLQAVPCRAPPGTGPSASPRPSRCLVSASGPILLD